MKAGWFPTPFSTVVRAHHQAAGAKGGTPRQGFGRSRASGGKTIHRIVFWTTFHFTTKIHLRVNGAGLPLRSDISPGETSDHLRFDLVMDDNLPEPCVLLADRDHVSDKVRKTMEVRNVVPAIPMRKSRKLRVAADRKPYRLRNLVERCFNKLENARRVAYPLPQDRRELPELHRHHLEPPLNPPFVNMT